jgi:branched-chain amino acid transport system substrate-binding protein
MFDNKKNLVFSIYVVTVTVIGPVIFWFSSNQQALLNYHIKPRTLTKLESVPSSDEGISWSNSSGTKTNSNRKIIRTSLGDKVLITENPSPDKQAAVQAFASGNYTTAIAKFNSSLQTESNDPESLIYLNNATALAHKEVLKIAVSVPIGGNLNVAKEILRGVAQAQNEINKSGGIGGKLLEVKIVNDDNDSELSRQVATELVKDQSVLATVGHNSSDASIAAAPVYQKGGLVMMSPTSTAPKLSEIGNYIFRTTPNTRATANALAEYVVNSAGKTKIAICFASGTQASESFKEEFSWAVFEYGGKIINTACDFSDPNFNPIEIPSQAISSGADALLLAPSLSLENINQAIEVMGSNQKRLTLLGNQTMYAFDILEQGKANANGTILSVAWHPDAIRDNLFVDNSRKLWGGDSNWRTAMAYDSTQAISTALKLGSTREQLQQSLSRPGFAVDGATGKVEFLPSGDRNMKGIVVKVQPGQKSGTGYDFVNIKP